MADITYKRVFEHVDWIDNEDVVQAGGPRGFNQQFHSLETEFDTLQTVVTSVNDELKKITRVTFLTSQGAITVPGNSASPEFSVEVYDRTGMPANVEKVYFPVVIPVSPTAPAVATFLYRPQPGNKMDVKVQFVNPTAAVIQFAFRVLAYTVQ